MSDRKKIVLLAIDAGDRVLIQNWAQDGTLPTIHSLINRGLVGETVSVEGLYVGSTWPSFYTSVNPGRHGFHRLTQINPGTYEFYRCLPGEFIKREPFWVYLSRGGKKVAVLDIPLSGITTGLNGIQTVEWGSHDGVYGFLTWPRRLKRDIIKRFGRHPLNKSCDSPNRSPQEFCKFRDHLIEGVNRKCELTLHYLKKGEWDFFVQVFTEGHCAGHQCWHLHDQTHPNYDPQIVSYTGDPIREVYRAIDTAIGRIMRDVDENTLVFFLATHRMAHNIGGNFMLEEILGKLNYLKKWSNDAPPEKQGMIRQIHNVAKGQWQKVPNRVRTTLQPVLLPLYNSARSWITRGDLSEISSKIDLTNCKCFPHPNSNPVSGIRINRSGREPSGLIKAGKEWEDFCEELSADLLNIVDRDSGKPMIKRIYKTADLFQGEYIDHLPDILVEWNDEKMIGSKGVNEDKSCRLQMASDKIGLIEGEYTYCRTGDHRTEGLFIVAGPGIKAGHMERTVSIMDFAPTFLSLLGLKIPDFDGKPIREIIDNVR
jgi:predicted AlkP superfamily phosphohydrolase/phosphomutase